jgi:tight adherence protein B
MSTVTAAVAVACCGVAGVVAAPSTVAHSRARLLTMPPGSGPGRSRNRPFASVALVLLVACGFGIRPTIALAAIVAGAWIATTRLRNRRRLEAIRAAVVEMCRATAAELRSGQPSGRALITGGQVLPDSARAALGPSFAVAGQGADAELSDLLMIASASPGLAGLSRLAACWRVAAGAGSALAPALDRIADGLQDEIDVGLDIVAALAGPRATVRLLAALPVVGLLLGTVIGADPVGFLVGSPIGLGCLISAAILDLAGLAWARRIAGSAARA